MEVNNEPTSPEDLQRPLAGERINIEDRVAQLTREGSTSFEDLLREVEREGEIMLEQDRQRENDLDYRMHLWREFQVYSTQIQACLFRQLKDYIFTPSTNPDVKLSLESLITENEAVVRALECETVTTMVRALQHSTAVVSVLDKAERDASVLVRYFITTCLTQGHTHEHHDGNGDNRR